MDQLAKAGYWEERERLLSDIQDVLDARAGIRKQDIYGGPHVFHFTKEDAAEPNLRKTETGTAVVPSGAVEVSGGASNVSGVLRGEGNPGSPQETPTEELP